MRRTSPEAEAGSRSPEEETVLELASRPAGSREGIGRKLSMEEVEVRRRSTHETGARPRSVQTPSATPRTVRLVESEGVLLKQNSWGSRKGLAKEPEPEEPTNSFVRRKEMWEKRTNSTPSSDDERASFRGNRDFWEHKAQIRTKTPGQTPDLVMDLPAGALASSPPVPAPRPRKSRSPSSDSVGSRSTTSDDSMAASPSLSSADNFAADTDTLKKTSQVVLPVPKPRPDPLVLSAAPRSQVVPIRSPGPRTPKLVHKFGSGPSATPGAEGSPLGGATSSFKPSVRVKPLLHVKPSENKKEPTKDLK